MHVSSSQYAKASFIRRLSAESKRRHRTNINQQFCSKQGIRTTINTSTNHAEL
jgi:hypothetical protein